MGAYVIDSVLEINSSNSKAEIRYYAIIYKSSFFSFCLHRLGVIKVSAITRLRGYYNEITRLHKAFDLILLLLPPYHHGYV